jgi:hypothetical protein
LDDEDGLEDEGAVTARGEETEAVCTPVDLDNARGGGGTITLVEGSAKRGLWFEDTRSSRGEFPEKSRGDRGDPVRDRGDCPEFLSRLIRNPSVGFGSAVVRGEFSEAGSFDTIWVLTSVRSWTELRGEFLGEFCADEEFDAEEEVGFEWIAGIGVRWLIAQIASLPATKPLNSC